jgi:hypothetical protein
MTADGAADAKDPRALGPIELWFDGDLGVATDAGQVSSWVDQSTHHRDLVRGNPTIPSIQVAAFPGSSHGALRFGPESTSNGGYLVRTGFTLPQPLTIAVALYPTDTSDAHYDIPLGGTFVPTVGIGRLGDGFQMVAGSGPTFSNIRVLGSWTAASHVVIATYDGTQSSLRVDDLPVQAATLSGAPLEGLAVGQSGPTFTGYIGEILIYGSALTPTQQASLGAYLRARFPR